MNARRGRAYICKPNEVKDIKTVFKTIYALCAVFFIIAGTIPILYAVLQGVPAIALGIFMLVLLPCGSMLKRKTPRLHKVVSRTAAVIFVAALCVCLAASAQIASCYSDDAAPEDAVMIVLGCGLSYIDQTSPSLVMSRRLEAALAYLESHPETVCVLSGGQGPDEQRTEAAAMYDYLVSKGIDAGRLYKEEASTSTGENIAFSKQLMLAEGLISDGEEQNLIVVTDGFHQFRAQQIGKDNGFSCYTVSAKTPLGLIPLYWLREIAGIVVQVWL